MTYQLARYHLLPFLVALKLNSSDKSPFEEDEEATEVITNGSQDVKLKPPLPQRTHKASAHESKSK